MYQGTDGRGLRRGLLRCFIGLGIILTALTSGAWAQDTAKEVGGEASLKLPDLTQVTFLGMNGHNLLLIGLVFCGLGLALRAGDVYQPQESACAIAPCARFPS